MSGESEVFGERGELRWGWQIVDRFDGTREEDGLTWSEDELIARYEESLSPRPTIVCGYCRSESQSRSIGKARDWFHSHPCSIDELQAARNQRTILWDLGALPDGHPFKQVA